MNLESRLYQNLVWAIRILRDADYNGQINLPRETFEALEKPANDYMRGTK